MASSPVLRTMVCRGRLLNSSKTGVSTPGPDSEPFTVYTAKTQYRKFETNIHSKGTARGYSSPNSYIPDSVSDLIIPLIGLTIMLLENRWAERGNQ